MDSSLSPAQATQVESIVHRVGEAGSSGRGRVVFVAGEDGSGRSRLLAEAGSRVAAEHPRTLIVSGGVTQDGFEREPAADGPGAGPVLKASAGVVASGAALLNPAFQLVNGLLELSQAALGFYRSLKEQPEEIDELLAPLLRAAAGEDSGRPVLCLVDDADWLDGSWWTSLQFLFAQEVASELRLVLVLAIASPPKLDANGGGPLSIAGSAARSLVARGLAEWLPQAPLSRAEVAAWIGPADHDLIATAFELSEGRAGALMEAWRDWRRRGLVQRDEGGRWQIAGARERVLAGAADDLAQRLEARLGERRDLLEAAWELLSCAAIEGRSFTGDALAIVTGREREEAIDLLDELVPRDGEEDDEDAILEELGAVEIYDLTRQSSHAIWRYRFQRSLDWRVARSRFRTEDERASTALGLASALVEVYKPEIPAIAHVLAAVCEAAGDAAGAGKYRQLARRAPLAVLRGRAKYLSTAETSGWSKSDYRDAAVLLVHAGYRLNSSEPGSVTLPLAEAAEVYSRRAEPGDRSLEARALTLQGNLLRDRGELDLGRRRLERARKLVTERAPGTLAAVLLELGRMEEMRSESLDEAKNLVEKAERLFKRAGDHNGLGSCSYRLASITTARGEFGAARKHATEALEWARKLGNPDLEAPSVFQLGMIANATGEFEEAKRHALAGLEVNRGMGDLRGEAACLQVLGYAELNSGEAEEALSLGKRARQLAEELEEPMLEHSAEVLIGQAARRLGRSEEARAGFKRAIQLKASMGLEGETDDIKKMLKGV